MAATFIKQEKPDISDKRDEHKTNPANDVKHLLNYRLKEAPRNGLVKGMERGSKSGNQPAKMPNLVQTADNSRCGEIFVTNNAKKWTFVCTFCQKSTRDIGEFVCHIKFKHLDAQYNDDDEYEQKDQMSSNSVEDSYNQGQDYFDCTNYLDVNVHTEDNDNVLYKQQQQQQQSHSTPNPIKPVKLQARKKDNDVVSLLDDEDDDARNDSMLFGYDYGTAEDEDDGIRLLDDMDDVQNIEDDSGQLLQRRASIDDEVKFSDEFGAALGSGSSKRNRSHVRGTAYCKLCDKTFQYYSLYRNHMIKHSNITPFKCQFCGKGFKSKQALRYHMKTHSREKPYTCPICPTTYATSNLFMTHVLSHESESCFPCMVCAKILKTDQEREEHLESHSEERPYSCSFCSKRFRQKHHLSNHLKLHCQYRCDFCKETFASTQTQRRPYACQTCEEMPDIRQQVERQRSLTLKNTLMEFENVMVEDPKAGHGVNMSEMVSDDESDDSNSLLTTSTTANNQLNCKYCSLTFSHIGALNFHLHRIHSQQVDDIN